MLQRTTVNHFIILKLVRNKNKKNREQKNEPSFYTIRGWHLQKTHRLKGLHIRLLFFLSKTPYKGFILHFFFFNRLPPLPSLHKCNFPLKWRFSLKLHPLKRKFLLHTVVLFFFFFFFCCFLIPSCDSRGLK